MTLGMLDAGHPALNGVSELRAARFFRYATIEPTPQDSVLMRLDDDVPLLLERRVGNGRVLLFTSSLDREWNDVPVQPAFVPFVAGLSDYLLGGAGFSSEAALGSTLAVRAMGLRGGQIFDPRGRAALTLGGTDDALLDQVGFYEVVGGGRTELVAVNFDARESDLRTMDEATIERWQQLAEPQTAAAAPAEQTRASMAVPLGPWVLWLLVIAAIMESWVGNWHLKVRRAM